MTELCEALWELHMIYITSWMNSYKWFPLNSEVQLGESENSRDVTDSRARAESPCMHTEFTTNLSLGRPWENKDKPCKHVAQLETPNYKTMQAIDHIMQVYQEYMQMHRFTKPIAEKLCMRKIPNLPRDPKRRAKNSCNKLNLS
ncbi:hypothetical protein VNO77_08782 [Canavalia gladiata]|uniref:Uncharacterized protein n=1 Tax=Canavalia gladiata TaxID=3824 RepID=A0AAN9R153_CANGL